MIIHVLPKIIMLKPYITHPDSGKKGMDSFIIQAYHLSFILQTVLLIRTRLQNCTRTRSRCVRTHGTISSARRSPTSAESSRHARPWPHSLQQIRSGNWNRWFKVNGAKILL